MRILFCIPYAGASAFIYRHWNNRIPDTVCIPLELKGRGSRWSEPFYTGFEEAIEDLLSTITPYLSPANRIGLFGHSMGALLAYELALAVQAQGKEIDRLFLSGRSCPQLDSNKEADHLLEDDLFVKKITSYGHVPSIFYMVPMINRPWEI